MLVAYIMAVSVGKILWTERSKARVCGHSLAGIAGSNPAGGMDVCVVWCN